MVRLYTEKQWRAIARVEELSEFDQMGSIVPYKRLLGPTWDGGEFYLCHGFAWISHGFIGPSEPSYYCVKEVPSNTRFVNEAESAREAIEVARERIAAIGPECLGILIAGGLKRVAEEEAERQRRELEAERKALAARERRERRLGRRARAVVEASEGKCHYCATKLDLLGKWHIEHKMPRALKGGSEMHNLVASCVPCNMRKRDKTDLEFQALLEAERAVQAAQSSVCDVNPRGSVGVVHAADSLARH